jgi:hypothetical protein
VQDAEDASGAPAASAIGTPIPHGVRRDRAERRPAAPAIHRMRVCLRSCQKQQRRSGATPIFGIRLRKAARSATCIGWNDRKTWHERNENRGSWLVDRESKNTTHDPRATIHDPRSRYGAIGTGRCRHWSSRDRDRPRRNGRPAARRSIIAALGAAMASRAGENGEDKGRHHQSSHEHDLNPPTGIAQRPEHSSDAATTQAAAAPMTRPQGT